MSFSRAAVIAIPPSSRGGGGFQRDVGRRRKRGWDQHQRRCGQAAAVGAALILATYYCAVHAIDAVEHHRSSHWVHSQSRASVSTGASATTGSGSHHSEDGYASYSSRKSHYASASRTIDGVTYDYTYENGRETLRVYGEVGDGFDQEALMNDFRASVGIPVPDATMAASPLLDDDDDDDDDGVVDVDDDIDGDAIGVDPLDEGAVPEASHAARAPPSSTASSSAARVRRRGNNGGAGLGIAAKAVAKSGGGSDDGSDDSGGGGSSATLFQQVSKYLVGDEAAEEIINRMNAAERADEVARAGEELEKILETLESVYRQQTILEGRQADLGRYLREAATNAAAPQSRSGPTSQRATEGEGAGRSQRGAGNRRGAKGEVSSVGSVNPTINELVDREADRLYLLEHKLARMAKNLERDRRNVEEFIARFGGGGSNGEGEEPSRDHR